MNKIPPQYLHSLHLMALYSLWHWHPDRGLPGIHMHVVGDQMSEMHITPREMIGTANRDEKLNIKLLKFVF